MRVMRKVRMISLGFVFAAVLAPISTAQGSSDCYHNGEPYPEGHRIGETVCENGRWVYK